MIIFFVLLNGLAPFKTASDGTKDPVTLVTNGESKEIEMNEFVLGPGDKMNIEVYPHDDLKNTIQIGCSGRIADPLVRDIQVGGLDYSSVEG